MSNNPAHETRSTCPYCGVGCGVIIESREGQITGVRGDPDHPANFGRLCTKGSTLHLTASRPVTLQTRLLRPMRRARRNAVPQELEWDAALDFAALEFSRIIGQHGPDAVGFYVSGQMLTEDYYVFNKIAKGLIGTNNIDSNSRLCMSSAVAGYKQTLGSDAPPACYEDIDHAHCIFVAGANPAFAHPVLFRRVEDAKRANPAMRIVVVDPRRTDSAAMADLHLAILPGTDVMLFNGMLHTMLWEGWTSPAYIAAHTTGFEALRSSVRDCTPDLVAQTCGIQKQDLLEAARLFATSAATLSLYCQGLNQSSSGTAKNAALINLHLATAQIGRPGSGPFSLTGQPNAMGGREVGGMANLLSGHRDLANPAHRAQVAALWGVRAVPDRPGKTAVEMFQAAADGEIKALWICCTNPAQSMPDQALVRRALERAELVVVQEAFATTATCAYADLLLPATSWGEKEGTVTNSERRISRVRAAARAPGEARHDWAIAVDFARRLEEAIDARTAGRIESPAGANDISPNSARAITPAPARDTLFPYQNPEAIWNEHRESTRGRDLDITGMDYALLDQSGPLQWPMRHGESAGATRLYTDGRFATSDGKARFVATVFKHVAEPRDARYPFSLTTGRLRDQWHGMSRTGTLGRLFGHEPEPALQMNPQDMARRLLREGELVHVTSRRGSIIVPLQASTEVGMGQAHIAMHWGEEYLSGCSSTGERLAGVNALTTSSYCPSSKQPELKHAAVKILKAELAWSLLALAWLPDDRALSSQAALRTLMRCFPFAACVPFSSQTTLAGDAPTRHGVLFRAAAHVAPPDDLLEQVEHILQLDDRDVLRYVDKKKGQRRVVRLVRGAAHTALEGFVLAGDTSAQAWIRTVLQEQLGAQDYGRQLLLPGAKAPVAVRSRGKPICSCFNVTDNDIGQKLANCTGSADQRLASLQSALQCGTNCGSCLPEIRRLVGASCASEPAAV